MCACIAVSETKIKTIKENQKTENERDILQRKTWNENLFSEKGGEGVWNQITPQMNRHIFQFPSNRVIHKHIENSLAQFEKIKFCGDPTMQMHGVLHRVNPPAPFKGPPPLDKNYHVPPPPIPFLLQFSGIEVPIPWFIESPLVWTKCSTKYNLLGICKIFSITNSTNMDCHMWFQKGIISFNYSNFSIHNYPFFSSYEIAVGKIVRQQLK